MTPIEPTDPEWAAIYAAYLQQGGAVVDVNGVMYQRVQTSDKGVIFCPIEKGDEKSSFGSPDSKWHGYYSPDHSDEV